MNKQPEIEVKVLSRSVAFPAEDCSWMTLLQAYLSSKWAEELVGPKFTGVLAYLADDQ